MNQHGPGKYLRESTWTMGSDFPSRIFRQPKVGQFIGSAYNEAVLGEMKKKVERIAR